MWEVLPSAAEMPSGAGSLSRSSLKETPFANGWLCFESATAKRRLAPIPEGWEFAPGIALEEFCFRAAVVPLRHRSGTQTDAPTTAV